MYNIRCWVLWGAGVLLVACGSDDAAQSTPDAPMAPDAPPAMLTVTASPARVAVGRGDTADLTVTVTRANTIGPVFIGAASLPSGVSVSPIVLVDGVDMGRVTVTAGPAATLATTNVQIVATAGAAVATAPVSIVVSNADGLLDRTFASSGYVTTPLGGTDAALLDAAVQSDGNIVVAGSVGVSPARNAVIARFHPDGSLDTTFGTAGVVTWDLGADDVALGVALLGSGRMVVTATSINGGSVSSRARLLSAEGFAVSSDPSFGAQGTISSAADQVASRPVAHAAGVSWTFDATYYRYAPAEATPLTTGGSNPVRARVLAAPDAATLFSAGNAASSDLAAGLSTVAVAAVGYTSTLGFGTNGSANLGTASGNTATGVVTRQNGNVVIAARGASPTDFTLSAVRMTNGVLATNFGVGGRVTIDIAQGADYAAALVGTVSGMIVGGVATVSGNGTDLALARIYDSGDLDHDFGTAGLVTTDIAGGDDGITALAVDGSGRLIAVGFATVQGHTVAVIARYSVTP